MRIDDNTVDNEVSVGDKYVRESNVGNGDVYMLVDSDDHGGVSLVCIEGCPIGYRWGGEVGIVIDHCDISNDELAKIFPTGVKFTPHKKEADVDICIHLESLDELSELWGRLNSSGCGSVIDRSFRSLKASPNPLIQSRLWDAVDRVVETYDLKE